MHEAKRRERNALEVAKYNVDSTHRTEARKALQAERDANNPRLAIHTRPDYAAVHSRSN